MKFRTTIIFNMYDIRCIKRVRNNPIQLEQIEKHLQRCESTTNLVEQKHYTIFYAIGMKMTAQLASTLSK